MRSLRNEYVILSGELDTLSRAENEQRTKTLEQCLIDCGFTYHRAVGHYKGTKEKSFFVNVKNETDLETLEKFAFNNFNQECILFSDINGNCVLNYDGYSKEVGKMQIVNPKYVEQLENFTIVNGKVLTTEKVYCEYL